MLQTTENSLVFPVHTIDGALHFVGIKLLDTDAMVSEFQHHLHCQGTSVRFVNEFRYMSIKMSKSFDGLQEDIFAIFSRDRNVLLLGLDGASRSKSVRRAIVIHSKMIRTLSQ